MGEEFLGRDLEGYEGIVGCLILLKMEIAVKLKKGCTKMMPDMVKRKDSLNLNYTTHQAKQTESRIDMNKHIEPLPQGLPHKVITRTKPQDREYL